MRRRDLLFALGALLAPSVARAQQPGKVFRIGWLSAGTEESYSQRLALFKERLTALGWTEKQNYVIERYFAGNRTDRLPGLARELAAKKPEVIVTTSGQATAAASKAAPLTPVVMASGADPVAAGFAKSLARPGGMITGLSNITADISQKYLEILLAAVPSLKRVGFLVDSKNVTRLSLVRAARESANRLRIEARMAEASSPEDIEPALLRLVREGAQGLVVMSSPTLISSRRSILEFARLQRWPVVSSQRIWVSDGALASYGIDVTESHGRAAYYVDRILKGAKPGDLPIEQPTTIELAINMKTAKALGLTIPQSVLLGATEVIE